MRNDEIRYNVDIGGYKVRIDKTATGFCAYIADFGGCVVKSDTYKEARDRMRKALPKYLQEMRDKGLPVPLPSPPVPKITIVPRRTSAPPAP